MIEKDVLSYDNELLYPVLSKAIRYADSLFIKNTAKEELETWDPSENVFLCPVCFHANPLWTGNC